MYNVKIQRLQAELIEQFRIRGNLGWRVAEWSMMHHSSEFKIDIGRKRINVNEGDDSLCHVARHLTRADSRWPYVSNPTVCALLPTCAAIVQANPTDDMIILREPWVLRQRRKCRWVGNSETEECSVWKYRNQRLYLVHGVLESSEQFLRKRRVLGARIADTRHFDLWFLYFFFFFKHVFAIVKNM